MAPPTPLPADDLTFSPTPTAFTDITFQPTPSAFTLRYIIKKINYKYL